MSGPVPGDVISIRSANTRLRSDIALMSTPRRRRLVVRQTSSGESQLSVPETVAGGPVRCAALGGSAVAAGAPRAYCPLMRLPGRTLNSRLSTPSTPVLSIEAVECSAGSTFRVVFESAESRWRQGIWFAVEGELEIAGRLTPQAVLWRDASPPCVDVVVRFTDDGLLRLCNVWDSGRGRARESQAATSGMRYEPTASGVRYRCSDINPSPTYEALVFRVERLPAAPS